MTAIRPILAIALCTAIGVAITVAASWALAIWAPTPVNIAGVTPIQSPPPSWPRAVPDHWQAPDYAQTRSGRGVTRRQVFTGYRSGDYLTTAGIEVHQTGWPLRSMEWERRFDRQGYLVPPREWLVSYWLRDGLTPPAWLPGFDGAKWRRIPVKPAWPGFAADTALVASLAWAVLFAPGKLRRRRRRRRGWCIACAYDLAGLARCPECGLLVDQRP